MLWNKYCRDVNVPTEARHCQLASYEIYYFLSSFHIGFDP